MELDVCITLVLEGETELAARGPEATGPSSVDESRERHPDLPIGLYISKDGFRPTRRDPRDREHILEQPVALLRLARRSRGG